MILLEPRWSSKSTDATPWEFSKRRGLGSRSFFFFFSLSGVRVFCLLLAVLLGVLHGVFDCSYINFFLVLDSLGFAMYFCFLSL